MDRQRFRDSAEFRCGFLCEIHIEVSDDNFGLFLGEGLGGVFADSLSTAGNDDYFSLEHDSPLNLQDVSAERLSQSRSGFNVEIA
jgi:hypothetical protein